MKFLFTYFISSGGMETLNRHRSKALQLDGVECHFLYRISGSGHQNITGLKTFIMNEVSDIITLIHKEQYDAIIVCTDFTLLHSIRRSGYKGLILFELQGLGNAQSAERYFIQNHAIIQKSVDAVLLPKTSHLVQLTQKYLSGVSIFSFHNCFDHERFHYLPSNVSFSPIIGWVGRIERNKRWDLFLNIGRKLIERDRRVKLWMFLDDTLSNQSERLKFRQLQEKLGLQNHLQIHNNIPNAKMAHYYSLISDSNGILCSTSEVEGFGYTLVEALSCRCPVLTTDSDGVRSIVTDQVSGIYFDSTQLEDCINKAETLIKNKNVRQRIITNGEKRIKNLFSLEAYRKNFLQMIHDLKKGR